MPDFEARGYVMVLLEPLSVASRGLAARYIAIQLGCKANRVNRLLSREVGPLTRPLSKREATRVADVFRAAGVRVGVVPEEEVVKTSGRCLNGGRHIGEYREGVNERMKRIRPAPSTLSRDSVSVQEQMTTSRLGQAITLEREQSDVEMILARTASEQQTPYDLVVPNRVEKMPAAAVTDVLALAGERASPNAELSRQPSRGWSAVLAVAYLAGVIGAGFLSVDVNPLYGISALVAVMTVLLVHAARFRIGHPLRELLAAMAVLPLLYVVPVVVAVVPPWAELSTPLQLTVTGLTLLLATLTAARALGYRAYELGLGLGSRQPASSEVNVKGHRWRVALGLARALLRLAIQAAIVLSGVAWVALSERFPESLSVPLTVVTDVRFTPPLVLGGLILLLVWSDELLFRGLLQRAAIRALGAGSGLIFSAFAFAASALVIGSPGTAVIAALFAGLVGMAAYLSGSLIGVMLAQALAASLVMGLLPSPELCGGSGWLLHAACTLQELVMTLQRFLGGY